MTKVAILYGGAEGPWQGKQLRKALHARGLSVVKDPRQANAIIAHSAGCFMLPENGKANVVLLIGIPYWPNKPLGKSVIEKVASEIKDMYWYKKTFFNTYYIFSRPQYWYRMWRGWQQLTNIPLAQNASIICVRNKHDPFMHPIESEMLAKKHGWKSHSFGGTHDDLWQNPQPYVDLLLKNFKTTE